MGKDLIDRVEYVNHKWMEPPLFFPFIHQQASWTIKHDSNLDLGTRHEKNKIMGTYLGI